MIWMFDELKLSFVSDRSGTVDLTEIVFLWLSDLHGSDALVEKVLVIDSKFSLWHLSCVFLVSISGITLWKWVLRALSRILT